jgi:hypothetical protein
MEASSTSMKARSITASAIIQGLTFAFRPPGQDGNVPSDRRRAELGCQTYEWRDR